MINPDLNTGEENPYEFIFSKDPQIPTNNGKGPLRNLQRKQYILFGIFAFAVIFVAGVVLTLALRKPPPTAPELVRVRSYQVEILRIHAIGSQNTSTFDLRKKINSLALILQNDAVRVSNLIKEREVSPTQAEYRQVQNTDRDKQLAASIEVDNHANTYQEILDKLVDGYHASIRAAEAEALTRDELAQLEFIRKNVEIIYLEDTDQPIDEPSDNEQPQEEPVDSQPFSN